MESFVPTGPVSRGSDSGETSLRLVNPDRRAEQLLLAFLGGQGERSGVGVAVRVAGGVLRVFLSRGFGVLAAPGCGAALPSCGCRSVRDSRDE